MASTEFKNFKNAVANIPVRSLKLVDEDELCYQNRKFLEKKEELTKDILEHKLHGYDTKELIKSLLNPATKQFQGIELIMQTVSC